MTDYPYQAGFLETGPPLDEMMFYDGVTCDNMEAPTMAISSPKHFAFSHQEIPAEDGQNITGADEGIPTHYIPHSFEFGIQSMQATQEQHIAGENYHFSPDPSRQVAHHGFFHPAPAPSQPSPATMTEFFQLMSQPEHVHAYMQFLQNQQEAAAQQVQAPAPSRSRSNSQPATSSFPMTPSSRSSWPDPSTDAASSRERKIAKYRTKRARRLTGSAQVPADSSNISTSAPSNDMVDMHQYMPAPKMQKTLARDLENRLMSSEEEVRMLQNVLASRDAELQLLRQVFDDQQRQFAMAYAETSSNPSSSACTSPRPRSPSTPAMVSSPSSVSIGSSTMDAEYGGSLESSSLGSSEHMDLLAAQRRQEKLKKLGGPPSDVYYPWWNGVSLNHPAFQQKEDWASVELRPHQDLLARERLNYLLNMQRFKMEQSRLSTEPAGMHEPADEPQAFMSHPYTRQPTAFYQSPHQSHIQTGSPVQAGGYWSGHFAPNTPEKIDFTKISLRKISSESPAPLQQPFPTAAMRAAAAGSVASSPLSPPQMGPISPHPAAPNHNHGHIHSLPQHHMQSSPTAAIWRDAMAHPEMHGFPQHLSWIQEQPELLHHMQLQQQQHQQQQQIHRVPFRRQPPSAASMSSTMSPHKSSYRGPSVTSPRSSSSSSSSSPSSTAMDC